MTERTKGISFRPKEATSEEQSRRLAASGCDFVRVTMEGHKIVFHPVSLAKLWDVVVDLPVWTEIPIGIHSFELVEFLVQTIVKHRSKESAK